MLSDRDVDDFVDVQEWIENLPGPQHFSLEVDFLETGRIRKNYFRTNFLRRLCDSGTLKTAAWLVATHVSHNDSLRASVERLPDNLGYDVGICIRCLLGSPVPPDIRFDEHYVASRDEPS